MTDAERRAALAAAVKRASRPGGLARACLLVARGAYPRLDPTVSLAEIARLAARVRAEAKRPGSGSPAAVLADVLGRAEGFGGAVVDFDDPEMSCLNRVLARRRGLPILLSVVWIEVARSAGFEARPMPFPGRYACMIESQVVDPYAGGRLLRDDEVLACWETGAPRPTSLHRASTPRRLILRVLANLANAWERRGDGRRLEIVLSDAASLAPEDPGILLRRGESRARFDDRRGALDDLNRALALLPPGPAFDRAWAAAAALVRARSPLEDGAGVSVN